VRCLAAGIYPTARETHAAFRVRATRGGEVLVRGGVEDPLRRHWPDHPGLPVGRATRHRHVEPPDPKSDSGVFGASLIGDGGIVDEGWTMMGFGMGKR